MTLRRVFTVSFLLANLLYSQSHAALKQDSVKLNQSGFKPGGSKIAVVSDRQAKRFSIVDVQSGETQYQGTLSNSAHWPLSDQQVKIADFSEFQKPGSFSLLTDNGAASQPFLVAEDVYQPVLTKVAKFYYLIRSGIEIKPEFAGKYARSAGHPDTEIYIHPSAQSELRKAGSVISSPKGWYDAGDYNKYIVNSNITVYTLLAALADYPDLFAKLDLNIPESHQDTPDLMYEILWNVDWMLSMQDPNDGGVYHKLTTKQFTSFQGMPNQQKQQRYVVAKSTSATLGFSAVMAYASRVLAPYKSALPGGYLDKLQRAALMAWKWAKQNPQKVYQQPSDVKTGQYSQSLDNLADEWAWAAAELFFISGNQDYLGQLKLADEPKAPSWADVNAIVLYALAENQKTPSELQQQAQAKLAKLATTWLRQDQASAYRLAVQASDFVWGSNGQLMNKAFILLRLNRLQPDQQLVSAAQSLLDYVLGRNPLGISYVTATGYRPVTNIHHRISVADKVKAFFPGMLSGGPYTGQSDKQDCASQGQSYPSELPALSFLEHTCSYASNETAINWNAPLVYVLAAFQQ